MSPPLLALLVPLLPALAAALIGCAPSLRRNGSLACGVAIAAAAASLCAALALLALDPAAFTERVRWLPSAGRTLAELGLRVDGISIAMCCVVGIVALAVQVYSLGYLSAEPAPARGRYAAWQSLFLFSMQGFVLSPNLLQLFGFFELIGLCSYLLIGYWHERPSAGRAALKAFVITKLGDIGFLIGLLVAWRTYGTFDLEAIASASGTGRAVEAAWLLPALIFCGVASKSAQFPLHVWLPDAMEGPTPVSALLHAATMVAAGVFLLLRTAFLLPPAPEMAAVVVHVGAFTALFAAVLGCAQHDVKRVLAYSTCSQLGLMVAALGAGGLLAGYFHLTTHAFFKALLFLAAGSAIHAVHTNDLRKMGGLARRMPTTAVLFLVGALALAGVPPLSGFFSKELVLTALEAHPLALLAALATTLLTPYYMLRAFLLAFTGEPRGEEAGHAHESGPSMLGPMFALAVLAAGGGALLAGFGARTGLPGEFHFGALGAVAVGLALTGLAAAWLFHGPRRAAIDALPAPVLAVARSGAVDRVYVLVWRRVLLALAGAVSLFDRYVVDGVMNLIGSASASAGSALRRVQTGLATDYVFALFAAVVVLAAWGLWGGG